MSRISTAPPLSITVALSKPRPPSLRFLLVLGSLMSLGSLSTDMYLPSLPALATAFHVDIGAVQLTLTTFLVGFCLGQLIWGPLGDRYGRRGMAAIGLAIFVLGSAGCAQSNSVGAMIAWRAFQAFGAAAGPVLARAMVRDLYARDEAARMLSVLILVMSAAPLLGPVLGGQVLLFWSWKGIFWVQGVLGLASLLGLAAIRETLLPENRASLRLLPMLVSYGQLLGQRRLLGYALSGASFYGAAYAYLAGTPHAYIQFYHVSPQLYGALFGLNIIGMMGLNAINTRFVTRIGLDRMLRLGTLVMAVFGIVIAVAGRTGLFGLAGLVVPAFFIVSMNGAVVANSVAGALSAYPRKAGAASAVVGALQFGAGVLTTAMTGWFADGTPFTYAWVMGVTTIGGLVASTFLIRGAPKES
jgi:DHA1 family bicyclomycin/chloramphenicol resistance-like MFS transporter